MLPDAVLAAIDRIRTDRLSGAVALARRAAEALQSAEPALGELDPEAVQARVIELARRLVEAQPAMAPLVNLASAVLGRSASGDPRTAIGEACRKFLADLEVSAAAIRRHGAALIGEGACVITHSYSQTVLEAILAAQEAGKRISVICTESRPQREGVRLARRLAEAGIGVHLVVDAAIYAKMPAATLALTGADSVSERGLVNKTGTSLLALAARAHGKPCYALCGEEKFLPAGYTPPPEPPKPPLEVAADGLAGVTIENFYFEATPLDLFTGVVTGAGLLAPPHLVSLLQARQLHPALAGLL
jgi:translation initiation factor 2B subunit (eIF-2B alpha/beta/delta family)